MAKQRVTLSLPEGLVERVDALHDGEDSKYRNRSEAVERLVREGMDTDELRKRIEWEERAHQVAIERLREEYEERINELETEIERRERREKALIERNEEHDELVEYVEEEQSWREAGLGKRLKWWMFGKGE